MLPRRLVPGAALSLLLAAAGAAGPDEPAVRFLAPVEGEVVAGETSFRFAVGEAGVDRVDVYVGGRLIGAARPPEWSLSWTAPLDLGAAEILALAFAGDRLVGRAGIHTSRAGFGEVVQVVSVDLFPVVLDRGGRYVRDLAREDFTVLEEGRPVALESFERTAAGVQLVVVLDVSGSMSEQIDLVKSAAEELVDWLGEDDRVAVYSFHHALGRAAPMSTDKQAAKQRIRGLTSAGGTALYDALLQVLDDIAGASARTVVVVFSDGEDQRSVVPLTRVVQRAREIRVVLYAVAPQVGSGGGAQRVDLDQIAGGTGGLAFSIRHLREVREAFQRIFADLGAQYRLSYAPPPGRSGLRRIEVRVARPRVRVRCRESYYYQAR